MTHVHILIIIFIILIVCVVVFNVIRIMKKSKNHHFTCPKCGNIFKADFKHFFFTAHFFGGACEEKCPKCGTRHMMKAIPDSAKEL